MSKVLQPESHPMEVVEKDIHNFQEVIRNHSDYDFTEYSLTSLRRRLTKILLEYDMDMDQMTIFALPMCRSAAK